MFGLTVQCGDEVGKCTILPRLVRFDDDTAPISEFTLAFHQSHYEFLQHRDVDLSVIADACGLDATLFASFETVLVLGSVGSPAIKPNNTTKIVVQIHQTTEREMKVHATYDPTQVSKQVVEMMVAEFEDKMMQLGGWSQQGLKKTVGDLLEVSLQQRSLLEEYTAGPTILPPYEFVHHGFELNATLHPTEIALDDGVRSISYSALDARANQIAHLLRSHGVVPNTTVALVVTRSIEFIVGMLGVIKSGGPFLPIEASTPLERISYMVSSAEAMIVLTNAAARGSVPPTFGGSVFQIDDASLTEGFPTSKPQDVLRPDDLAYTIFTSGTTGLPKGVQIPHAGIVSRTAFHPIVAHLAPGVRMLQTFTIGFDACLEEIFHAFHAGATIVLWGRDNLAEVMKTVDVLMITPTGLQSMDPKEYSRVKAICVGGEACHKPVVDKWGERVELYSDYGPTEATMVAMCTGRLVPGTHITLGRPLANTRIYILDERMREVPVGVMGRLFIGGVGMARGYLNKSDLTASKFVPDVRCPHERMYDSGDLGRWLGNGEVAYLGRSDDQVKLKGYRVELDEVAAGMAKHFRVTAAAAIVKDKTTLVGFYTPKNVVAGELRDFVSTLLPSYMVPSVFIGLDAMPTNVNGKTDKKALAKLEVKVEIVKLTTEAERRMAAIWADTLSIPENSIGRNMTFFELGGDSISAIRLVAKCKKAGLALTTTQIFKSPTLAGMSVTAKVVTTSAASPGNLAASNAPVTGVVPITPVQWEFFNHEWVDRNHYNQGFVLKPREMISLDALTRAIARIVEHHDMLRARFALGSDGTWTQRILSPGEDGPTNVATINLDPLDQLDETLQTANESLSITDGPIYVVRMLNIAGNPAPMQRLLFTAHHLVVDLVSWRIILEDLETLLRGGELPPKTLSFKGWAERLLAHATTLDPRRWDEYRASTELNKFGNTSQSTACDIFEVQLSLDAHTSSQLDAANVAYGTNIQELVLAALTGSMAEMQSIRGISSTSDNVRFSVDLEGHGREPWSDDLDVSNTVGWFTSVYPMLFETSVSAEIGDLLRQVKQKIRAVPEKGLSYGLIKYLAPTTPETQDIQREHGNRWAFNYLGRFQNLDSGGFFQIENVDRDEYFGENDRLPHAGTFQCIHKDNRLVITYRGESSFVSRNDIEQLFSIWSKWMRRIVAHCTDSENKGGRTLTDVPLLGSMNAVFEAERELADSLNLFPRDIEDMYPVTPLQAGFLAAMMRNPAEYTVQSVYDFSGDFDLATFKQAWSVVVCHHSILRTVFVSTVNGLVQAITKKDFTEWKEDVLVWEEDSVEARTEEFMHADRARGFSMACRSFQRFTGVRISDGWSDPILMCDLIRAYMGVELPLTVPFRNHVEWLHETPIEASQVFWKSALKDARSVSKLALPKPSVMDATKPKHQAVDAILSLPHLRQLCKQFKVTSNTVLRTAWAIVLRHYTRNEHVLFGSVTSGRDSGIDGLERLVGMLINTIPIPAFLPSQKTIADVLLDMQNFAGESTAHSHCSLVDVQRWAGKSSAEAFFDTLFVFENYPSISPGMSTPFKMDCVSLKEYVDYAICMVVRMQGDDLRPIVAYDSHQVDSQFAEHLLDKYIHVLKMINDSTGRSKLTVADLDCLTPRQEALLDQFGSGPKMPLPYELVHHGFEQWARKHPDWRALEFGERCMTYGELDAYGSTVAAHLSKLGVCVGKRVGVIMQRCLQFPVGLLGVLKAGAAIIPIDSSFPVDRIRSILLDAGECMRAIVSVTSAKNRIDALQTDLPVVWVDELVDRVGFVATSKHIPSPEDIFTIVYTSGSTGTPKGVPVKHISASNTIAYVSERLGYWAGLRTAQCLSISFTVGAIETWCPLNNGATVVLHVDDLFETVRKVDTLFMTPTGISRLGSPSNFPNLKFVQVAGEVCPKELKDLWVPHVTFNAVYGCSEIGLMTTQGQQHANDEFIGGNPVANTVVRILDKEGRRVPVGVVGELFVSGIGVSPGYLNLPELTAERILPDPFVYGARMFKSCDRARFLPNGRIQVIGRDDQLVKLKGYRIELDEIVLAIKRHPKIVSAAVIVKNKSYLVGFFTPKHVDVNELREILAEALPTYMVPSVLVGLTSMPTNVNGKLDRKALMEMDISGDRTELSSRSEKHMATIWADVLGVPYESIGRNTSFFELGGDSITAITVISRSKQIGLHFSVADLFKAQTLSRITAVAERNPVDTETMEWPAATVSDAVLAEIASGAIPRSSIITEYDVYPTTPLQTGMIAAAVKDRTAYVEQFSFKASHDIDLQQLQAAFRALLQHQDIMRTAFVSTSEGIFQIRHEDVEEPIAVVKGMDLVQFLAADKARGFTLDNKRWIRVSALFERSEQYVVITASHAVYDGWSHPFIVRDLLDAYSGLSIPERPPFRSVVDYMHAKDPAVMKVFWREYLDGIEASQPLNLGRSPKDEKESNPVTRTCSVPSQHINDICKRTGITAAVLLKAAWALTLRKYTRNNDIVFGQVLSGRDIPVRDANSIVGPLMSGVPCRVKLSDADLLVSMLRDLQEGHGEVTPHSHVSTFDIQHWLGFKGEDKLFDTMFIFENLSEDPRYSANRTSTFTAVEHPNTSLESDVYSIELYAWPSEHTVIFNAKFKGEQLSRSQVAQMIEEFDFTTQRLVECLGQDELHRVGNMWELSPQQRSLLAEYTKGPTIQPTYEFVHHGFELNAVIHADEIALDDGVRRMSYAALDARANQIAHLLRSCGVVPNTTVALVVTRSIEFIAGMLGVIKSGGAFLPIEASTPSERISYMVSSAEAKIVLTTAAAREAVPSSFEGVVFLIDDESLTERFPTSKPQVVLQSDDLAYTIFTSGTTGLPKGVRIPHAGIVSRIAFHPIVQHLGPGVRMSQTFTIGFDACLQEIFFSLTKGATLVLRDKTDFSGMIASVDVLSISPTGLQSIAPEDYPNIKVILSGAEACPQSLVRRWGEKVELYSDYGPTETTIAVMCTERLLPGTTITLGRPLANTRIYVLDDNMREVPIGVMGRVFIGGVGMARGYLNKPDLTASKFVPDLCCPGERMYDSGDLGRWLRNGEVAYLGRSDDQVKLKGYRIELDEVVAGMTKHPRVTAAAAIVRNKTTLVGFFSPKDVDSSELRDFVSDLLPSYMVPSVFVGLDAMLTNVNGKTDKKALAKIEIKTEVAEVKSENERHMATIWADVLGISPEAIGRNMSFFEMGGDSISAIRLVAKCKQAGLPLTTAQIFKSPTLAAISLAAENVHSKKESDPAHAANVWPQANLSQDVMSELRQEWSSRFNLGDSFEAFPTTPMQQGMIAATIQDPSAYINQLVWQVAPSINVESLRSAFHTLVAHHSILRTTFATTIAGGICQIVHTDAAAPVDVRPKTDLVVFMSEDKKRGFAVGDKHWLRLAVLSDETGSSTRVLKAVLTLHHVFYDGWSLPIITEDLKRALEGVALVQRSPFRSVVDYVYAQDPKATEQFWTRYFEDRDQETTISLGFATRGTDEDKPVVTETLLKMPRIQEAARSAGVTAAVVLKTAWALTVRKFTRSNDILFGNVMSGRDIPVRNVHEIVGNLVATVPCRVKLDDSMTTIDLLRASQSDYARVLPHSHASLVDIQRWSNTPANIQMLDTLFVFENIPDIADSEKTESRPLLLSPIEDRSIESSKAIQGYAFELVLFPENDSLISIMNFNHERFSRQQSVMVAEEFDFTLQRLVESVTATKPETVAQFWTLSPKQMDLLSSFSVGPTMTPPFAFVHHGFEQQANINPTVIAVDDGVSTMSYSALDARANQIAHLLRFHGVVPNTTVALVMTRSIAFIVGMLGVIKSGGAFLPIEASTPSERISYMVSSAEAMIVLTNAAARGSVPPTFGGSVFQIDDASLTEGFPTSKPQDVLRPDDLAYTIFTSGTTGLPKGVQIPHAGIVSRTAFHPIVGHLAPGVRMLQTFTIGFDACLEEIFHAFHAGATIVLWGRDNLAQVMKTVAVLMITPTGLQSMDPKEYPRVKAICVGGEACQKPVVDKWGERVELYSDYGPTEATMVAMCTGRLVPGTSITLGRPLANTRIYILDEHLREVPVGVMGRLFIGGVGMARGYLNKPDLTASKLVPDLRCPEERMYDSGDLGRWLGNGEVAYLGRSDDQVKLKGYRVELDEVAAGMAKHPQVTAAAAIVKDKTTLVGFYTPKDADYSELRDFVSTLLPSYMVPSVFVGLDAMPTNVNGKTDKKALAKMEVKVGIVELTTEAERRMAAIWADTLGIPENSVGRIMTFFELGGDSISAIRLVAKCKKSGLALTTTQVFKSPTLAEMSVAAQKVETETKGSDAADSHSVWPQVKLSEDVISELKQEWAPRLHLTTPFEGFPTTPLQQGMILATIQNPSAYINHLAFNVSPAITLERLRTAFHTLVSHHNILRTTFAPTISGGICQIVHTDAEAPFALHIGTDLNAFVREDMKRGFVVGDKHWVRLTVLMEGSGEGSSSTTTSTRGAVLKVVLTINHALYDGWSLPIIIADLHRALDGTALAPRPSFRSVVDYICAQDPKTTEQFWKSYLDGIDRDASMSLGVAERGAEEEEDKPVIVMNKITTHQIQEASRKAGVTAAVFLKTAWALTIRKFTRSSDVLFADVMSGRDIPVQNVEEIVGMLVATVPCRIRLTDSMNLIDLLRTTQSDYIQVLPHSHANLVDIQRWSQTPADVQLLETLFVFENIPDTDSSPSNSKSNPKNPLLSPIEDPLECQESSKTIRGYILELLLFPEKDNLVSLLRFDHAKLSRHQTVLVAEEFDFTLQMLAGSVSASASGQTAGATIGDLWTLSPQQMKLLTEYSEGQSVPLPYQVVHHGFERWVRKHPQWRALEFGKKWVSYGDLDVYASTIAAHLSELDICVGKRVAVVMTRCLEFPIALLGALKTGASIVPIDCSSSPADRISYMLNDCGAVVILSTTSERERIEALDHDIALPVIWVDNLLKRDILPFTPNTHQIPTGTDEIAIVYTSGSTGKPKGVIQTHAAVSSPVIHVSHMMGFRPHHRIAQILAIGFSASLREIWCALNNGSTLVLHPPSTSILETVQKADTLYTTTTGLMSLGHPSQFPNLKFVCIGSEGCPVAVKDLWAPCVSLHYDYGCSETSGIAHIDQLKPADPLIACTPFINTTTYILDQNRKQVPIGAVGEIFIGGVGVSPGYVNLPELTAERFLPDPFIPGGRMFKTGDLGRMHVNGRVQVLGRLDDQIKLRGYRIDLDGVAAVLMKHPKVTAAAAIIVNSEEREEGTGEYLAAFVSPANIEEEDLLGVACDFLPAYMVPAVFIGLDKIPTNINGKTDRKALLAHIHHQTHHHKANDESTSTSNTNTNTNTKLPPTPTELTVQSAFARVLKLQPSTINLSSSFFGLGGNSISLLPLIRLLNESVHPDGHVNTNTKIVRTDMVFRNPSVRSLARAIDRAVVLSKNHTNSNSNPNNDCASTPSSGKSAPSHAYTHSKSTRDWLDHDEDDNHHDKSREDSGLEIEATMEAETYEKEEEKKLRIVCFHGQGSNVAHMEHQLEGVSTALGEKAEFIFVQAPLVCRSDLTKYYDMDFYEWYPPHITHPSQPQYLISYLTSKLQSIHTIDGLLGFSQGAAVVHLLDTLSLAHKIPRLWKFSIFFSGVCVPTRVLPAHLKHKLEEGGISMQAPMMMGVPSVHVWGSNEGMWKARGIEKLRRRYDARLRVELRHGAGHDVPRDVGFGERVAEAILAVNAKSEEMRRCGGRIQTSTVTNSKGDDHDVVNGGEGKVDNLKVGVGVGLKSTTTGTISQLFRNILGHAASGNFKIYPYGLPYDYVAAAYCKAVLK
ncbi:hypothetical protein HK102_008943 [Quaeritorhiza haematococci]|nr:hypothetical protein HK102_008943 [Quaeritorhiza haematococci]